MPSPIYCVIGAGTAGGRAAISLRQRGFDGRLVLISDEPEAPYERPPLSKAYLNGKVTRGKVLLQAPEAYLDQAIELRPATAVSSIDLRQRKVQLTDGEQIPFDQLLLATGSRPRRLDLPGASLEGVVTYRTVADADRLRAELESRPEVVVVGGGFLGSELAAAARLQGCRVTILESQESLLAPLGELVGGYCAELHREAGVELLFQESAARFRGKARVEQVLLRSGRALPCDLALICVGVQPNSELAHAAGLDTDPGVVVGDHCQTASHGVFAAGDVASRWSPRWQRRLRFEHFDNAQLQGIQAAQAMLGETTPYDPVPYFWTEQYRALIQQVGLIEDSDEMVLRGEPQSGRFSVFYLQQGILSGCLAVNRFPDLAAARRLIPVRVRVSAELLRDPTVDLRAWSEKTIESAEKS